MIKQSTTLNHKGKKYKVYGGKKGGIYIIRQNKKVYLQNGSGVLGTIRIKAIKKFVSRMKQKGGVKKSREKLQIDLKWIHNIFDKKLKNGKAQIVKGGGPWPWSAEKKLSHKELKKKIKKDMINALKKQQTDKDKDPDIRNKAIRKLAQLRAQEHAESLDPKKDHGKFKIAEKKERYKRLGLKDWELGDNGEPMKLTDKERSEKVQNIQEKTHLSDDKKTQLPSAPDRYIAYGAPEPSQHYQPRFEFEEQTHNEPRFEFEEQKHNEPVPRPKTKATILVLQSTNSDEVFHREGDPNLARFFRTKPHFTYRHRKVGDVDKMINEINSLGDSKIAHLIIMAHGSRFSLQLSDNNYIDQNNVGKLSESLKKKLIPGAVILLHSCCVGKGGPTENNFAKILTELLPDNDIYATEANIHMGDLSFNQFQQDENENNLLHIQYSVDNTKVKKDGRVSYKIYRFASPKNKLKERPLGFVLNNNEGGKKKAIRGKKKAIRGKKKAIGGKKKAIRGKKK